MEANGIALVTGASRGIGCAVALELAGRGFEVVATMRDPAAGRHLAEAAARRSLRLEIARLDVDRPETIALPSTLRVLVNNAGIEDEYLPVEEAPLALWRRLFETNVFGLIEVTRRAIPLLRASKGVLCNVTSSSLLAPVPFFAAYRASKAAVSAIGETLRAELAPHGVRVLEVMPGPIATDMLAGSDRPPEALRFEPYRAMAERSAQNRAGVGPMITSPEEAARRIADAILDDASPLRVGCDPMSEQMLAGWRGSSDEAWMRGMLGALCGIEG